MNRSDCIDFSKKYCFNELLHKFVDLSPAGRMNFYDRCFLCSFCQIDAAPHGDDRSTLHTESGNPMMIK